MLIIPPAPFRRRRGRVKQKGVILPPGLLILSVAVLDPANPGNLTVSFSGAITWDVTQIPNHFEAQVASGMHGADDVITAGADYITLFFFDAIIIGGAWSLNSEMQGITPAVAFPQSGTVIS